MTNPENLLLKSPFHRVSFLSACTLIKAGSSSMRSSAMRVASRRMLAPQHRTMLTAAAYNLAKKQMPKMSETEKIALGAGTVNLFFASHHPAAVASTPHSKLTPKFASPSLASLRSASTATSSAAARRCSTCSTRTRRSSRPRSSPSSTTRSRSCARCSTTTRSRPTRT